MTWSVIDMVVPVSTFAHELADHLYDGFVINVVIIRANNPGFTHRAFVENNMHRFVVVVDMYPVTHLFACAIELRLYVAEYVRNLTRDKLFDVLAWTVIV